MKAPDKIYMPNELLSEVWGRHIKGEDTVYIRKDALLEWLKDRRAEHSFEVRKAYQRTIEKIESL